MTYFKLASDLLMSGLRAEKSGFYNKAGGEIFLLSTLQKQIKNYL